ncbi:type I restriction endonuclease subunit R [Allochromatium humboldtianum]|uniref:Type I restriction endonuclease subunit R n=1 Tax=Allochromatium humboldtianum TaxID=504901 RepID=A0A850RM57_9GAMM|nr:type I restriction endonuclease subunit R [Allochromatium humboldtianum]NVZ10023.1 type I restriction endonuclease subunit R [Allochromatium humboldtianum]
MVSKTNEQALEAAIQRHLTGLTTEGIAEHPASYNPTLFRLGWPSDFDAEYALDTRLFWEFLEATQNKELTKLKTRHPNDWQRKILERFDRLIKKHGILHLLKKGLAVDDAHFTLMYPAPLAGSAARVHENFAANLFSLTRQVRYSQTNPGEEIDTVLFINGLPLITIELKNPWTGQTARYHGQKQYRTQRDPTQPLLQFGRALVHFAVDTDEVFMTTKLAGPATVFLPFNKGHNQGEGNPPNPNGHKTAYLWEDIFTKDSLARIIQHFILLEGKATDPLPKKTLIFPRYHQLEVVRRLLEHVAATGVGYCYLIQHSAGSGKSNSITWTAYQLIETYPARADIPGAKGLDQPLFDSVIVVTDRRLLDKQLRDNIKDFSEVKNIVAPALRSADLKAALEHGKKIIITTIQKFPYIIEGIADLSDKRFAVIIDEAHSSQSGSAHDDMNRVMGQGADDFDPDQEQDDPQEQILAAMRSRKMRGNASYFAFTATPKNSTLEKFGERQPDGRFKPFHLYSMKQAIEEGFILNVLANYTTYKSYYEIRKSIADNPLFDTQKAQKKLRAHVERHPRTINIKAEIMLDHFIEQVVTPKKLRGKAKGMIVTQNIEAAIRYHQAVSKRLADRGHPFKALIAFSGEKLVDGLTYTEAGINGFPESDTRDRFDADDYRLLVVANKYLTGFDQPKLTTMYVDKKLQHVLAVQALSRLNRSAPKLGKRTEDLFILDFFNEAADIKAAFDPFYTVTTLSSATDVNVLHELKDVLDQVGVYERQEIEDFVTRYFAGEDAQTLSPLIDTAADRFNRQLELTDKDKIDFKIKARQFVKIYSQMAAIMPFEVIAWEKLFWFLKFLLPKLKITDPDQDQLDALLEAVDLSSYGLERTKLNHSIDLDASPSELDPHNPNPRGYREGDPDTDPLDEIIRTFNERWFQGWSATPEEQRVKFINVVDSIRTHPDYSEKYAANSDPYTRELALEKMLQDVMLKRRKEELELYKLFASDPAFKSAWSRGIEQMLSKTPEYW